MGKEIAGVCDSEGVLLNKRWRGTGRWGTGRKGGGRCTGGWRRGGKRDSQGGGKREGGNNATLRNISQSKKARGGSQQIQSGIKEYGKWGL